ncbi:MAG TPA: 50S ribosomal protein L3 N(5)-glutamine methyltransferase [Nevskiaceae bacterium]
MPSAENHAAIEPQLRTVRDWVRWGASAFGRAGLAYGHGTDNALDEAFHLVAWALKLPWDLPAPYLAAALTDDECRTVHALLERRIRTRAPAAYLTGEAWFAGLPFFVDEHVLVPRSPIAELIEAGFRPWLTTDPRTVLDLCCGCGCIGIACALAFPAAEVELVDVDRSACAVAERNVARHDLADRVRVLAGDLYAPTAARAYDLIVCNPPYVPTAEWQGLAPEYRREPRLALEAGTDGMDIVARVLATAADHLAQEGMLVCEVGGSRPLFEARFPDFPATWPEFERGGDGVFVARRDELAAWMASRGT